MSIKQMLIRRAYAEPNDLDAPGGGGVTMADLVDMYKQSHPEAADLEAEYGKLVKYYKNKQLLMYVKSDSEILNTSWLTMRENVIKHEFRNFMSQHGDSNPDFEYDGSTGTIARWTERKDGTPIKEFFAVRLFGDVNTYIRVDDFTVDHVTESPKTVKFDYMGDKL